jgi:hypothetical protein
VDPSAFVGVGFRPYLCLDRVSDAV